MAPQSPPVAFVLSGGGSLGAIQVGMLRALYERDIEPDLIVATSAGAINGAFIAARPQRVETADELAVIWRHVRRGQVFPLNPLSGLLGFLGTRAHMVPDCGLRQLVSRHVEQQRLEQLPIRCTSSLSTSSPRRSCSFRPAPSSTPSWPAPPFHRSCRPFGGGTES
jgi:NTE family protein